MQAIKEREKRRFVIHLNFHFSFGTYLPMCRMKHKIKESKIQQKTNKKKIYIYIFFKVQMRVWGTEGGRKLLEIIPIKK